MSTTPTARTRLFALLGDPVSHSLSPAFQNAALRATGLDAVYLALPCDAAGFTGLLRGIARAGGGGNVTVPHKQLAVGAVERRTDAVQRTGACNTFWADGGEIWGDNTDVSGVKRALLDLLGGSPAGSRVLLLGAGGAASAAICALADLGAGEVVLLNRTSTRATALADRYRGERTRIRPVGSPESLRGEGFDVAINATSLGLRPEDPLPLGPDSGIRIHSALDLVYAPQRTPWVRRLRESGVAAEDGLPMLLHQGAAAFERWHGVAAPIGAMAAALPPRPDRDSAAAAPAA